MVKKQIHSLIFTFLFCTTSLFSINTVYFGGMEKGVGFTDDDVDIVEDLIINNLVESSFFSLRSIENASNSSDLAVKGAIGYLNDEQISLKLWLIDNRSNQIILARELPAEEESFFTQLDQFTTEFISTVYQFLYGATEENIFKLVQMEQFEHANLLLNYYREKNGDQSLLNNLEIQINDGYADRLKNKITDQMKRKQPIEDNQELIQYILYSSVEDLDFLNSAEEYQLKYIKSVFDSLSKEIQKHLRNNNPEMALFLYNNFISQNTTVTYAQKLYQLKLRIDEDLKKEALKRVELGLSNRDFSESEYQLEQAINSVGDPSDTAINEALLKWEIEKDRDALNKTKEFEADDIWTPGFRKTHDISLSLNASYLFDVEHEILINGFFLYPEISYRYQKPLLPPFYLFYDIGLNLVWGESSYNSNNRNVRTQFYWGHILPGLGIMVSFQKMDFHIALNSQLGLLYRSIDYSETIGTVIEKRNFSLGFEISIGGKYYLTDLLALRFDLNYNNNYIFGSGWLRAFGAAVGMSVTF